MGVAGGRFGVGVVTADRVQRRPWKRATRTHGSRAAPGRRHDGPAATHRPPGACSGSGGSVFLDVLVAILIGVTALLAALGGVAAGAGAVARLRERAAAIVEARNEQARAAPVLLGPER